MPFLNTPSQPVGSRPHPQETYAHTEIDPVSFFGKLRRLYRDEVLYTQLEQLKKQGSYYAFNLEWQPVYDVRRIENGFAKHDGNPPSLFWESDVAKWIEAACYFLSSPDAAECLHAAEFNLAVTELVDMIENAQQSDGYLNVYFTAVDPNGKLRNLRDLHEMYNAGHLIEAALAHYRYTGSPRFVDVMTKNVEFFRKHIGPGRDQLRGYPGHPEIELALLRLHSLSNIPEHLEFARYLLEERGRKYDDLGGESWYVWEPKQRQDFNTPPHLTGIDDLEYNQSHATLHEQQTVRGHSVRALYLITGAADIGGDLLEDAYRLWTDAVDNKMYATGGLGSEPFSEGFSPIPHWLPQSTGEGGCYAETCASIACMMVSERLLSHKPDGKIRDVLELCLYNNVLGGGSLNGKQFSYANKHATWGNEVATRCEWFEVCCCPPNLSRTMGMLGGYTWTVNVDECTKTIRMTIYLFLSATRVIELPHGQTAKVCMTSEMPWVGETQWTFEAPEMWSWEVTLPRPAYATNLKISANATETLGFLSAKLPATSEVSLSFEMPIRLLAPHSVRGRDTLTVTRGPIVYTAEGYDNKSIDAVHPHFDRVGISSLTDSYSAETVDIGGISVVMLSTGDVYTFKQEEGLGSYHVAQCDERETIWQKLPGRLTLVPWFARANRGGSGRIRTDLLHARPSLS